MDFSENESTLRSADHVIRKSRRGHGISRVSEYFPELHCGISCNIEVINRKHGYISEEISKQSVDGLARFLLGGVREGERRKVHCRKTVKQEEPGLPEVGSSQPS